MKQPSSELLDHFPIAGVFATQPPDGDAGDAGVAFADRCQPFGQGLRVREVDRVAGTTGATAVAEPCLAGHVARHNAIGTIASSTGTNTVRSVLDDWADMQAYTATIRTPRAPTGLSMADVTAGRALFTTHGFTWRATRCPRTSWSTMPRACR